MPAINEPTMHERLWEWLRERGAEVSAEVEIGNGRIDLIAYDSETDEYVGIEVKDQADEGSLSTIPSAIAGVGEDGLQQRDHFDWESYWEQLHRYQTSGYLDRLYFASQRPESVLELIQSDQVTHADIGDGATVAEIYEGSTADQHDIGAIQLPGPHGDTPIKIVREAESLPRGHEPTMSRTNERWVQHHIWKHVDGIREGVLPNSGSAQFRRIDVAVFTGSQDPTTVYKSQSENDIIGIEAKGAGVVRGETDRIEQQLHDYLTSGALTKLYLGVPAQDREHAVTMLQAESDEYPQLGKVGLFTVDEFGSVKEVLEPEKVTLRYDGIHTKEGYVTDVIWGYGTEEWDQEKQYYSVFKMLDS